MFLNFNLSDKAIGYVVDGTMSTEVMLEFKSQILTLIEKQKVVNLYLEDGGIFNFSLRAIIIAIVFPYKYSKHLNKVAMVIDKRWIHYLLIINKLLTRKNYKYFTMSQKSQVIDWIEERNENLQHNFKTFDL